MPTETALLSGVRVVELSSNVGPAYAGRLFAWLGADVETLQSDVDHAGDEPVLELVTQWLHAGKRISDSAAPAAWLDADVVLVDMDSSDVRVQEAIAALRTELASAEKCPVVVELSSVRGAELALPGSGLTAAAWSGLSWSMGSADREPLSLPYDIPSYQVGAHAVAAAVTALLAPGASRALRKIDVATRDILSYYTGMITANFIPYERPWARDGARPPQSGGVYPASIFPCKDGFVTFMCRSQREWDTLIAAMGHPEWSREERFRDPRVIARLHADEADEHLLPWIAAQTREELLEFGRANGLPVAPVRSFAEVLAEPQFAVRDFFEPHPVRPDLRVPGRPWKMQVPAEQPTASAPLVVGEGATAPTGILSGLKVLDLSWVWSGPMVTSMLADLGAVVIKVEHEGHMDSGRIRGRARRDGVEVEGPEHEVTPYFNQMCHGKQSVTLDLKKPEARELLLELAAGADVIVENMRPGALAKVGLGYDDVAARNPSVVMLSMSMAGQSGPLSALKGYAGIMAAMSGLDSLIGYGPDELIGSLTPALGDPNGASHAMVALMAALHRRQRTGLGSWIDLSQIEALLAITAAPLLQAQIEEDVVVPVNRHPRRVPHGHFPAAGNDSWVALAVTTADQWSRLSALAAEDGADLGDATGEQVLGDTDAVDAVERSVVAWSSSQPRDQFVSRLLDAGIPAAPVNDYDDLMSSTWLQERELTRDVEHPYLGRTHVFVVPWRFGGATAGIALPAPQLGQHTDLVLDHVLGIDPPTIGRLRDAGALR
jgi:crotonobetainyl-CoA:carnitine CoA-transferase CaiB-like acyl-CoA transferase